MFTDRIRPIARWLAVLAVLVGVLSPGRSGAQAPTLGVVEVTVHSGSGQPLTGISVSLERGGTAIRTVVTDRAGRATFNGLAAGEYALLVEQFEYQPVRYRGVRVEGGGRSRVTARLLAANGVVDRVEEQVASVAIVGGSGEDFTPAWRSRWPGSSDDAALLALGTGSVLGGVGRPGILGANGLPASYFSLRLDGLGAGLLRHPALPGEPLRSGLFTFDDVAASRVMTREGDLRFLGAAGGLLDLRADPAGTRPGQAVWAAFGPGVGASAASSAGDSTALSFRGGAMLAGRIQGDTAAWQVRVSLFQDQVVSADPFASGASRDGEALAASIQAATTGTGRTAPTGHLVPRVRSVAGGSGTAALSWRFGDLGAVSARVGASSWTEQNPALAGQQVHGAGVELKGRDIHTGLIAAFGAGQWTSTTSLGLRNSTRDWLTDAVPFTSLAAEGVAFGAPEGLPGYFKDKSVAFSQAFTWRMASHLLRGGFSVQRQTDTWDWVLGGTGRYLFGDVAGLQAGEGVYQRSTSGGRLSPVTTTRSGAFLQDSWRVTPGLEVQVGVQYDKVALPDSLVPFAERLENVTGLMTTLMPANDASRVYPMASFRFDADGSGRTVVTGGASRAPLDYDRLALAEVARVGTGMQVHRADGDIGWGAAPTTTTRTGYTSFAPGVQRPRASQVHLALAQRMGAATLTLRGGYTHSDYLMRRSDWNRHQLVPSTGSDGRPIYGDLRQYGGLIVPATGTNRRYQEFDMLSLITGDGYADHYEAGVEFEQPLARGLRFRLGYTFARTTDNLIGQLSADPADRLSPFPDGLDGVDWTEGRSDLDVPHRITADLVFGGNGPMTMTARYRFQSGLPFTPGAPRGVDLNGDGSGGNDPIALGQSIAGLADLTATHACLGGAGRFAERNACRDPGIHAVDLGLVWRVGGTLALTVDALNAFASPVGLRDHAAVHVDPSGAITRNSAGRVVLPLIANERFGELISRRGDPRLLRIGFRLER